MNEPETIILVSVDDLRHDCFGFYEDHRWPERYGADAFIETPTFDGVAETGRQFRYGVSTASHTPPTHASMFTGAYPKEHGVKTFFTELNENYETLASVLSEEGYSTHAWIENIALDMLDITRGFDEVECPFRNPDANLFEFIDDRVGEGKTFLFIHLFDVHKPYLYTTGGTERDQYNEDYLETVDAVVGDVCDVTSLVDEARQEARSVVSGYEELSEPLREYGHYRSLDYLLRKRLEERLGEDRFEYLVRLYVRGVSEFDRGRFSDLVETLKRAVPPNYLTVVTADHGETVCEAFDRKDLMNGPNVSEGAVRVPFIVDTDHPAFDGFAADGPIAETASHVDLLPTVAAVVGTGDEPATSGESLLDVVTGTVDDRFIFHETWYGPEGADFFGNYELDTGVGGLSEVGVRSHPEKLVFSYGITGNPKRAVYNIETDPLEETNRYDTGFADDLERELESYLHGVDRQIEAQSQSMSEDEHSAIKQQLKALGYLDES